VTGLLALAFGAGLLAPVNPCGFGLLPAVLTATSGGIGSTDDPGATPGPLARLSLDPPLKLVALAGRNTRIPL